jgi:hypothetical protein
MLTFLTTLTLGLAPVPQGVPNAKVVINEFQYDDYAVAPDVREFVELYNRTNAPVDISGWTLTNQDVASSPVIYTIPASTVLPAGGYWVMGSAVIPNVNQILTLAPLRTELLWNENSSLTLRDTTNTIIDTAFYEANKGVFLAQLKEGEGLWGNFQSTAGVDSSWSRVRDGHDTNDNGRDFRTIFSTPGATNNRTGKRAVLLVLRRQQRRRPVQRVRLLVQGPRVIDPTLTGTYNVNAIPVSPQGGLAMIMWDEAGGGNSTMLLSDVATDWVFEAWSTSTRSRSSRASTRPGAPDSEAPAPCSTRPTPRARSTRRRRRTATRASAGRSRTRRPAPRSTSSTTTTAGADHKVLGSVALTHNVNDGWQRLRLEVTATASRGSSGGASASRTARTSTAG